MKYKAKILYKGWDLNLKNPELYVGIPEHKFNQTGSVVAEFEGGYRRFDYDDNELISKPLNDQFGKRDQFGEIRKYRLLYFKWN